MNFYDKLTTGDFKEVKYSTAQPYDDDVKQTALLRSYISYLNTHGSGEGFEEFYRTPKGENRLKKVAHYAYVDLFNSKNMKKHNRGKDILDTPVNQEPVSMSNNATIAALEAMSHDAETNINAAQKQMELQDELRDLYVSADEAKKQAMDLMVEAMQIKDDGKPIPDRIRKALSRLRIEIQKTDPRWKLDLHLL